MFDDLGSPRGPSDPLDGAAQGALGCKGPNCLGYPILFTLRNVFVFDSLTDRAVAVLLGSWKGIGEGDYFPHPGVASLFQLALLFGRLLATDHQETRRKQRGNRSL